MFQCVQKVPFQNVGVQDQGQRAHGSNRSRPGPKDGKHRTSELLYGYPPQTIGLKQNTPLFRLLTQIQDEVHRFAITFHRDKRSKRQIASALDEIKGIGEKTKSALLKEFKSVKRIREASAEELAAVVGEAKAKIIQTYFSEK